MMNYKILFSDMDGTLLRTDKSISSELKKALDSYIDAGGRLVLTSGRPPESILEVAKKLHIDYPDSYLIGYNGAVIYDCKENRILHKTTISRKDVGLAQAEALRQKIHLHTYEGNQIVAQQFDSELDFYTTYVHMDVTFKTHFEKELSEEPFKMIAIDLENHKKLEEYKNCMQSQLSDRVQVLFSTPKYLEFLPKEAGKGNAVSFLCNYLNIPLSQAVAIGDEENDISMILAAGLGIAMKNGNEHTKQAANLITEKTNDEDALVDVIHKLLES